jgi:SAM-dependent methyltransferase
MPHDRVTHDQRDRAESFGAVADEYDRFRPGYPSALVDDLLAGGARSVLDVGCGTGKAARMFAARGARVLGVEPDPQMAAVARAHGIEVEVGAFETWDAARRRFDLVVCAQAWHWVDPVPAAAKVAAVLAPGGRFGAFWNFGRLAGPEHDIVQAVYERLAPELIETEPPDEDVHLRALRDTGVFGRVEAVTYPGETVRPVDEWIGYLGTQSAVLLLGPRRPVVLDVLRGALAARGPDVRTVGGTYLIHARP